VGRAQAYVLLAPLHAAKTSSTRSSSSCLQQTSNTMHPAAPAAHTASLHHLQPSTRTAAHMLHAAVALQHACRRPHHHNSTTTPDQQVQPTSRTWHTGYVVHQCVVTTRVVSPVPAATPPLSPGEQMTTPASQQAAPLHKATPAECTGQGGLPPHTGRQPACGAPHPLPSCITQQIALLPPC
jgi:hypothetical protein